MVCNVTPPTPGHWSFFIVPTCVGELSMSQVGLRPISLSRASHPVTSIVNVRIS